MGGAMEKDKEAFRSPATRGSRKDSDRAITPVAEAVCVPALLAPPGSSQTKQLCQLHAQPSLMQSCHMQKTKSLCTQGCFGHDQLHATLTGLWPVRLLCQGFSRQEYWGVLDNTGCHTLLGHYISCCCNCQPSWVPGAASPCDSSNCTTHTPGPHRDRHKFSRAASGAIPSGQPTCRGRNKTTVETQPQSVWGRRTETFPPAAQTEDQTHTIN